VLASLAIGDAETGAQTSCGAVRVSEGSGLAEWGSGTHDLTLALGLCSSWAEVLLSWGWMGEGKELRI
jgi:hypothetical protein